MIKVFPLITGSPEGGWYEPYPFPDVPPAESGVILLLMTGCYMPPAPDVTPTPSRQEIEEAGMATLAARAAATNLTMTAMAAAPPPATETPAPVPPSPVETPVLTPVPTEAPHDLTTRDSTRNAGTNADQ